MPFVTSVERVGSRGLRMSIEYMLQLRFGDEGQKLMSAIREIYDDELLQAIMKASVTANNPDEVRRLWTPGSP